MRHFLAVLSILCVLAGCAGVKSPPANSAEKAFSPLLHTMGDTIPAQWEGKGWNPKEWPLPYQNKDKFIQNLFDSDILRDQYIKDETIPILVVGPNFYHLSDHDQIRICDTINQLYGATAGQYGAFLLQDWYSKKIIGEYSKGGLALR